ncbi:hypothetical protein [Burkholderia sp. S171]|uniref:hypothetical protein n=1 Tax=Burkholderia sp. S171 TaxID=1641860 RepID=UPI00131BBACA|nr:hypothetical protein [Burkholderia sp. S171]
MVNTRFALIAVALVGALGFAVSAYANTPNVLLEFSVPMTGAPAQYGKVFQSGVLLAQDDFNATKTKVDGKGND